MVNTVVQTNKTKDNIHDIRSEIIREHIMRNSVSNNIEMQNIHPTAKPIKLMSYLITLTTRENDIVLDPFTGSGTTAISSILLRRRFI